MMKYKDTFFCKLKITCCANKTSYCVVIRQYSQEQFWCLELLKSFTQGPDGIFRSTVVTSFYSHFSASKNPFLPIILHPASNC